jgi:hypothetical protein
MKPRASNTGQDERNLHPIIAHKLALLEGTALLELAFNPSSFAAREVLAMVARVSTAFITAGQVAGNGA